MVFELYYVPALSLLLLLPSIDGVVAICGSIYMYARVCVSEFAGHVAIYTSIQRVIIAQGVVRFCIMHARCVYSLRLIGVCKKCVSVFRTGNLCYLLSRSLLSLSCFCLAHFNKFLVVCKCVRSVVQMVDLCRVSSVSRMNYDIDLLFIASY